MSMRNFLVRKELKRRYSIFRTKAYARYETTPLKSALAAERNENNRAALSALSCPFDRNVDGELLI